MEKKYRCKECGKEYCWYGWCVNHYKKTGHYRFKQIKEDKFKMVDVTHKSLNSGKNIRSDTMAKEEL